VLEFVNMPRRRTYTFQHASVGANPVVLFRDEQLQDGELAKQEAPPADWAEPFDSLPEPTNNADDDPLVRFDQSDRPPTLEEDVS